MPSKKNYKIPFDIRMATLPNGEKKLVMGVQLQDAVKSEKHIKEIEEAYLRLLEDCDKLVKKIDGRKHSKMKEVTLNWELGDMLYRFLQFVDGKGFIPSVIIGRYLQEHLKLHNHQYWSDRILFRRAFPDKDTLLPIGYNLYNEIQIAHTPKQQQKLLKFVKDNMDVKIPTARQVRELRWKIGGSICKGGY